MIHTSEAEKKTESCMKQCHGYVLCTTYYYHYYFLSQINQVWEENYQKRNKDAVYVYILSGMLINQA